MTRTELCADYTMEGRGGLWLPFVAKESRANFRPYEAGVCLYSSDNSMRIQGLRHARAEIGLCLVFGR